jgi:hypothetical protein
LRIGIVADDAVILERAARETTTMDLHPLLRLIINKAMNELVMQKSWFG